MADRAGCRYLVHQRSGGTRRRNPRSGWAFAPPPHGVDGPAAGGEVAPALVPAAVQTGAAALLEGDLDVVVALLDGAVVEERLAQTARAAGVVAVGPAHAAGSVGAGVEA